MPNIAIPQELSYLESLFKLKYPNLQYQVDYVYSEVENNIAQLFPFETGFTNTTVLIRYLDRENHHERFSYNRVPLDSLDPNDYEPIVLDVLPIHTHDLLESINAVTNLGFSATELENQTYYFTNSEIPITVATASSSYRYLQSGLKLHSAYNDPMQIKSFNKGEMLFTYKYWNVASYGARIASAVSDSTAGNVNFYFTFQKTDDIGYATWNSFDVVPHKLLKYLDYTDYSGVVLDFDLTLSASLPSLSDTNPISLQIEYLDNSLVNVNVASHATNISADQRSAHISLPFYSLENTSDSSIIDSKNIRSISFLVTPVGYVAGDDSLLTSVDAQVSFSNITCNKTFKVQELIQNSIITYDALTNYDEIFQLTPERVLDLLDQLGFKESVTHSVGRHHYFNTAYDSGAQKVLVTQVKDATHPFINPSANVWHTNYFALLKGKGYTLTLSFPLSLDSQYCPFQWTQRDWSGNASITSDGASYTFFSPSITQSTTWANTTINDFCALMTSAGLDLRVLLADARWEYDRTTLIPFIYDPITKLNFTNKTALTALDFGLVSATLGDQSPYKEYLSYLSDTLGTNLVGIEASIKTAYPNAKVGVLFEISHVCSIKAGIMTKANYPFTFINSSNFDFIGSDVSLWSLNNQYLGMLESISRPIDELKYQTKSLQVLSGYTFDTTLGAIDRADYTLEANGEKLWSNIFGLANYALVNKVSLITIETLGTILRDSIIIPTFKNKYAFFDDSDFNLIQTKFKEGNDDSVGIIDTNPVPDTPVTPPTEPTDVDYKMTIRVNDETLNQSIFYLYDSTTEFQWDDEPRQSGTNWIDVVGNVGDERKLTIFYTEANKNQDLLFGNWYSDNGLISIDSFGSFKPNALQFYSPSLVSVPSTLPDSVTDLSSCFQNCTAFNQDLDTWDIKNVTSINSMFYNATSFNGKVGTWDVSSIQYMYSVFASASSFNQDLSNWDISNVVSLSDMFDGASAFNQDIGNWDTSNVTDMSYMFYQATSFNQDIGNWSTSLITSIYSMSAMFYQASSFNQDLSGWDVSNISSMPSQFDTLASSWVDPNWRPQWGKKVAPYVLSFQVTAANNNTTVLVLDDPTTQFKWSGDTAKTSGQTNITLSGNVGDIKTLSIYFNTTNIGQNLVMTRTDGESGLVSLTSFGAFNPTKLQLSSNLLTSVPALTPSSILDYSECFKNCTIFNGDISSWNTSHTTNMESMFEGATAFNQDLSDWNVTLIPSMPVGFNTNATTWTNISWYPRWGVNANYLLTFKVSNQNLPSYVSVLQYLTKGMEYQWDNDPIQAFNTALNITGTVGATRVLKIFYNKAFKNQNLNTSGTYSGLVSLDSYGFFKPNWMQLSSNILTTVPSTLPDSVTILSNCFEYCSVFDQDLSGWDTSNVKGMGYTFHGATVFNQDLSSWNTGNVTSMSYMFANTNKFNGNISNWDTSKVTSSDNMFSYAYAFNQDINSWDVSHVYYMNSMFANAINFNQNLPNWNPSAAIDTSYMFSNATKFNGSLSGWNVTHVNNMSYMFQNCSSFNQDLSTWDVSAVTNMSSMFSGCLSFNGNISNWNVSNVANMPYMFQNAQNFNQPLSNWVLTKLRSTSGMFSGAAAFNQDLTNWNTSQVTSFYQMFYNATSFNGDISGWDTSKVTSMGSMFSGASSFNRDISTWNTSLITDMSSMFYNASAFNQSINTWDVTKVTNMSGMFFNTKNFNQPLNTWNTGLVTNMTYLFYQATAFNQDLSTWNVSKISAKPSYFDTGATAWTNAAYRPVWGTVGSH